MVRKKISFRAVRKGKPVKVEFTVHKKPSLPNNPDKTKIDSLEKGLRNLSEHENLAPRLLKIEKDLKLLNIHNWINAILFFLLLVYLLIFGGMLL